MCHFYQHPRPSSMTRLFVAEQNNRKWITTSGATTNYTANSMEKEAITAIAQGNLACSTIVSASSGRYITGSREPHFKTMRRSAKFCVNNINVDHKVGKTYTARAPKKINWYFISFSYCLPRSRFFAPRHASRSFVLAEQAEIIRSHWLFSPVAGPQPAVSVLRSTLWWSVSALRLYHVLFWTVGEGT